MLNVNVANITIVLQKYIFDRFRLFADCLLYLHSYIITQLFCFSVCNI